MMKKLNLFQTFDFASWQTGKTFMIQSAKFSERKGCVTLDVIITEDKTEYGDPSVSNLFEKFKVHLIKETNENSVAKYKTSDLIRFTSIGRCTVWGDYSNQLSVEAVVEVVKK